MRKWFPAISLLIFSGLAAAQPEVTGECERLGSVAASAVQNKSQGITKSEMADALPSLDQPEAAQDSPQYRLLQSMYKILDEVFDHESLNRLAYMVYKSEACIQEATNGVVPRPFDEVHPELLACSEFESSDQIIECSMRAAGATDEDV